MTGMTVFLIYVMLLGEAVGSNIDTERQEYCRQFTSDNELQNLIASGRRGAEPCPCIEQKIILDNTCEKIGNCYKQWFFREGAKEMCCYSENGSLITGGSSAGYLLLETKEEAIGKAHQVCCGNDSTIYEHSCKLFYDINPPDNCSTYLPPSEVISSGDPMIETIDGNSYDFNGHGEYVFLTDNTTFEIQARTRYVMKGNKDATMFTAFALSDKQNGEQIELHYDRDANDIRFYRNGTYNEICNASSLKGHGRPYPCEMPKRYSFFVIAGGGLIIVQHRGLSDYVRQVVFRTDNFMSIQITPRTTQFSIKNVTGLAGHQEDGFYIMRNKSRVAVNASASLLFDFAESWALQNDSESIFKYEHTGGNFTSYNKYHTRPKFLEDLVGNLTALFKAYTIENITLFNNTCRNYWNNEPNEQCLLTIARTGDYSFGVVVMKGANATRHKWEILHNIAPEFSDRFPHNITVQYEKGSIWSINLTDFVTDDHTKQQDLTFEVQTKLPTSEYIIENGIFTWTVGTGLRYIDTYISFAVIDSLNATSQIGITVNYCGCEEPEQCSSFTSNSNSTDNVRKASCNCPEYATGLYCEKIKDTCPNITCYQNDLCNSTANRLSDSWPCAPCPNGRDQVMTPKQQTCEDIDECAPDYNGLDKCQQLCNNSVGSFNCGCRSGYRLNADNHTCIDIDECKIPQSKCTGENEVCLNTEGNFSCICKPGYSKKNGACEQKGGYTYVGHMSFTISVNAEHVFGINKTIDTYQNRKDIQDKIAAGFNNTKGFLGVEVFRLTLLIHQGNQTRPQAGRYDVRADYVVHWKNGIDIKDIDSDNILCNLTSNGNCDPATTDCQQQNGTTVCKCKDGYGKLNPSEKFCIDIDECAENKTDCSGHG
ncbi:mucin-like protein, partial [Mercenaria mercenaria]|uniref:mucin-like protein n=1 Tax=Mercenaria mercenaria TaxID=6596 RepID=UPI00234E7585